jgi:hypothetical protein
MMGKRFQFYVGGNLLLCHSVTLQSRDLACFLAGKGYAPVSVKMGYI